MSASRNWKATVISGTVSNEIIVNGEANVGMLTVVPELRKKVPQGINPHILLLDLLNASDAHPEHFVPVQYNERIGNLNQYTSVEVWLGGHREAEFPVHIPK